MKFRDLSKLKYQVLILFLSTFLIILAPTKSSAQNTFTFAVNMQKTIDCGLFSPSENDRVIIRGSFNNWSGNVFQLEDKNRDDIYEQSFEIQSDTAAQVEFKYLIIKSDGKELWEKYPNPENSPNGNRIIDSTNKQIDDFDFDRYYLGVIGKDVIFPVEELRDDFIQFRKILEEQHCCLYEYTNKQVFDSLFDVQYNLITKPISPTEFYKLLTPVTAKIGCGHTAVWMPGGFWDCGKDKLFPLKIRLIEDRIVVEGSYNDSLEIEKGSIIDEINGVPVHDIIAEMRENYSADAMNINFINSQIERRFPLIYARRFGFKDQFQIQFTLPGKNRTESKHLSPVTVTAVRSVVFSNFNHPPLRMELTRGKAVVLKIPTFIYYDRIDYFTHFIDSCFAVIKNKDVKNLILDLRGNDGGDPFCSAPLFSYLQKEPSPYFAEPYGKYSDLAKPLPLPENRFTGNLFTIIDGRCFSTNGHFCALLKHHNIGKFVGTESGATYKCNAGRDTEFRLNNTKIMVYIGRSTFAAAVEGMDKTKPIIPDYPIHETLEDFLAGKDTTMDFILDLIKN